MKTTSPQPEAKAPPRPRGRPRSFDREAALEAAMEVFWHKGFDAASLSDLTEAMGINPPSLYAAFGDKEKLYLEAVESCDGPTRGLIETYLLPEQRHARELCWSLKQYVSAPS